MKYKTKTASELEIYSHLKECNDNFYPRLDSRVNLKEYSKKLHDNSVTFEAWADSVLIGLIAAYFNDIENRSGFITNVSIIFDYTQSGIAAELMNMCIRYAKEINIKEIKLEVSKNNFPAIHLYNRFGFINYINKTDFVLMKLSVRNEE